MYELGAIDAMRGDCDLHHKLTPKGQDILDNSDPKDPKVTMIRNAARAIFETEEHCPKLFEEFPDLFYSVRVD